MRALVIAILCTSSVALARDTLAVQVAKATTAAEAAIHKGLDHKASWNGVVGELTPDAIVVSYDGALVKDGDLGVMWLGMTLQENKQPEGTMMPRGLLLRVGKLSVTIDPNTTTSGWFAGTLIYAVVSHANSDAAADEPPLRMTGIVSLEKGAGRSRR